MELPNSNNKQSMPPTPSAARSQRITVISFKPEPKIEPVRTLSEEIPQEPGKEPAPTQQPIPHKFVKKIDFDFKKRFQALQAQEITQKLNKRNYEQATSINEQIFDFRNKFEDLKKQIEQNKAYIQTSSSKLKGIFKTEIAFLEQQKQPTFNSPMLFLSNQAIAKSKAIELVISKVDQTESPEEIQSKIKELSNLIKETETLIGEPDEKKSLTLQIKEAKAAIEKLSLLPESEEKKAQFEKFSKVFEDLKNNTSTFQSDAIFDSKNISAIEAMTQYANTYFPCEKVIESLLGYAQTADKVSGDVRDHANTNFDEKLTEAEKLLDENEAVLGQILGEINGKLIGSLKKVVEFKV